MVDLALGFAVAQNDFNAMGAVGQLLFWNDDFKADGVFMDEAGIVFFVRFEHVASTGSARIGQHFVIEEHFKLFIQGVGNAPAFDVKVFRVGQRLEGRRGIDEDGAAYMGVGVFASSLLSMADCSRYLEMTYVGSPSRRRWPL